MREDAEMLTVKDALAHIKWHFTESDGLIARIERGEEVDERQVQEIETAFLILQAEWKEHERIPKHAVQILRDANNAILRLDKSSLLYPQRGNEIRHFMTDIFTWMDAAFSTMSEEAAIAAVCQQLLGVPSFVVELRQATIDEEAVKDLFSALDVLARVWKNRKEISKLAAQAMVSVPWIFRDAKNLFSGADKQRLNVIQQQLDEHITRCLS